MVKVAPIQGVDRPSCTQKWGPYLVDIRAPTSVHS